MNGRETSIKNPAKKRLAQLVDALLGGLVRTGRLLGMNRPRRGGLAPERIARILVVRLDHIGDVIMTTPVLRLLKERYPEGMVTCLVASWGKAVVENNPYLDELLIYDAPWWKKSRPEGGAAGLVNQGRELLGLLAGLRRRRFDLLVDPRGDLRHLFFFGYLGGIGHILSYDRTGGRYLLAADTVFEEGRHEIDKAVHLLAPLGVATKGARPRVEIYPAALQEEWAEQFLRHGDLLGRPLFIFAPGARKNLKRWPERNFAELADWLLRRCPEGVIVLAGAPWDREVAAAVVRHSRRQEGIIDITGQPDIASLFALMKRSRLIVANDGPIAHLSSALDVPAVALFGPVRMERFRPPGEWIVSLQKPFPCSPCLLEDDHCLLRDVSGVPGACMEAVTVAEVEREIEELWGRYGSPGAAHGGAVPAGSS